jgi:hypothetical protein
MCGSAGPPAVHRQYITPKMYGSAGPPAVPRQYRGLSGAVCQCGSGPTSLQHGGTAQGTFDAPKERGVMRAHGAAREVVAVAGMLGRCIVGRERGSHSRVLFRGRRVFHSLRAVAGPPWSEGPPGNRSSGACARRRKRKCMTAQRWGGREGGDRTSAIPQTYISHTTAAVPQLYFSCTSDVHQLYLNRTSAVPQPYLSRTSAVPQPYLSRTSAVPQPYLSRTSAVPQPYLSRTSAVPQPYVSRTSAIHQPYITGTSAIHQPYPSRTSAVPQPYISRTLAVHQPDISRTSDIPQMYASRTSAGPPLSPTPQSGVRS